MGRREERGREREEERDGVRGELSQLPDQNKSSFLRVRVSFYRLVTSDLPSPDNNNPVIIYNGLPNVSQSKIGSSQFRYIIPETRLWTWTRFHFPTPTSRRSRLSTGVRVTDL